MDLKAVYESLLRARRPIDFFGEVLNEVELNKVYRKYAKLLHPDTNTDKYVAAEAFKELNKLFKLAKKEIEKGIYSIIEPLELYKHSTPLFEIDLAGEIYKFYEHTYSGDVADIFKGATENNIVYLKVAQDRADNKLIDNEFNVLSKVRHVSLPFVEERIQVNDTNAIIMREVQGVQMPELFKEFPRGIPAEHVMWMLERMFSVVGYLHYNKVLHGNIKPEHIIIDRKIHNVSILGFSFCIPEADTPNASYKIINENYTAPEVNKTAKVWPSSDIYSVGKIAVKLLGGDIKTNGMPITIHPDVRNFVRKLVNESPARRPNDAWELWDEVIELRNKVFGTERFKTF